jgi:putative hemolysin
MIIILVQIVILIVLLILSAFFSSSETALFTLTSVHIAHIRDTHKRAADLIEAMRAQPNRLLSTILIGNTLVNFAAASLGYALFQQMGIPHAEIAAIVVMTIVLLIVGEVVPKRLAMAKTEWVSRHYAPILTVLIKVLKPLRHLVEGLAARITGTIDEPAIPLTEDEFLTVVEVGEEEGVLDKEERTMVDGIIGLEETHACDVMTPRVDLVSIDLDDPLDRQIETARSVCYRYIPVYRSSIDQIEGLLDLPAFLLDDRNEITPFIIAPIFIPETKPLDQLLSEMQRERSRVAVVLDEYGGTAGLVTRGDILEEIADDVDDEFSDARLTIRRLSEDRWLVDGSVSIEDVADELDVTLEAENADRIAGWVIAHAGKIPKPGEVIEAQGLRATVQRVRQHRITVIQLRKLAGESIPEEPA